MPKSVTNRKGFTKQEIKEQMPALHTLFAQSDLVTNKIAKLKLNKPAALKTVFSNVEVEASITRITFEECAKLDHGEKFQRLAALQFFEIEKSELAKKLTDGVCFLLITAANVVKISR